MKSTIENISNIARAQKQVFEDFEKIDFQSVLSEVLDENEEVIKASKAKVFDNFVSDYDFICSRNCIKSILYNFLTNAIKYRHPDRHPEIFISTCLKDDTYCFSVKDNGLGIDLERHRHKLFGIFKRFHDHVEGTGIGLYMVKRMVEKNQGRIEVDSIPGCGTVFTVIFPLQFRKEKKMSEFQRL
jgi:signal transduction histidine kinase